MSDVEEIKSAIDKLTELRGADDYCEMNGWLAQTRLGASGAIDDPGYEGLTNDPLIVTLYRTIDAQIALLSHTVEIRANYVEQGLAANWDSAVERAGDLALARAINGVTS
jgi:hypothetical protein